MYYRGAAAALVVYDITSAESFTGAQNWITELQTSGSEDIVIGLAGNKMDLESQREVKTETAADFAHDRGCIFFETSAKTGENVAQIFSEIAKKLPKVQAGDGGNHDENMLIITTGNEKKGCC
jgi:Ras-related protein Rab-5C